LEIAERWPCCFSLGKCATRRNLSTNEKKSKKISVENGAYCTLAVLRIFGKLKKRLYAPKNLLSLLNDKEKGKK
jgi:hypothetical protein